MDKKCNKCGQIKDISQFYNYKYKNSIRYKTHCKECVKESKRISNIIYYRNTKEERKEYNLEKGRKWRNKNKDYFKSEKNKEQVKKYSYNYLRRPEIRQKKNEQNKKRRMSDAKFHINSSMKNQIWYALREKKSGKKWESFVGYSINDLMNHLESLFKEGMTFENYGEWHIDHKKPKKLFNYNSPEDPDFKECWALKNLQPLWAEENLSKGYKYREAI